MGKRRDKRRRNRQRTTEEIDLVREKEMERVEREERADAERRAKHLAPHAASNPPPSLANQIFLFVLKAIYVCIGINLP
jgi:hypothetical protein